MEVITGVSTADEFVEAINEKGASLTNKSTPESLLEAINATGGNISFKSTNGEVIEAVNAQPISTLVDWEPYNPQFALHFLPTVEIPYEEPYIELIDRIKDASGREAVTYGDIFIGEFDISTGSEGAISVAFSISTSVWYQALDHSIEVTIYYSRREDTQYIFDLVYGATIIDGVATNFDLSAENILELPIPVQYDDSASCDDIDLVLRKFIKVAESD